MGLIYYYAVALFLLSFCSDATSNSGCTFFLSQTGDDTASGLSSSTPFATLTHIHAKALSALSMSNCSSVSVHVSGGEWLGPWVFDSASKSKVAITYIGAGPDTIITGGVTVTNFTEGADGFWRANVPAGTSASQLFVNGNRRPRARAPNVVGGDASDAAAAFSSVSTFAWAAPLCAPPACNASDPINGDGLVFAATDGIDASWDFSVAEVTAFSSPWSTCVERVKAVFASNRTILFTERCTYGLTAFPSVETGRRWLIENVRGVLDVHGEFFLNESENLLEYIPLPGESIVGFTAVLAQHGSLLVVNQDGLTFEDLTVEFAAIDTVLPSGTGGRSNFAQSGAIEVNASDVSITRVKVLHTGANCIVLRPGVARVTIANNTLMDCGGHGIYMDTQDKADDILITDTRINGVGFTYLSQPTGILLNGGTNISAVHNAVFNSSYTGISVAWMHGVAIPSTPAIYRFNVSYNRITDFGRGILSDFAGVRVAINNADSCFLTDTCYVPTLVSNNIITGGRHYSYGANGLYTDNAVAGVDAIANIIADIDGMGFQTHCGVNNSLTNTLIFDARAERYGNCSISDTYTAIIAGCNGWRFSNGSNIPAPFSASIAQNILVATRCNIFSEVGVWPNPAPGRYPGNFASTNFSADDNVYFSLSGSRPIRFPLNMSFDEWKVTSGNDLSSIIGDPLITDPRHGDFTIKPDSPAWALGWKAIDTNSVGPR